MLASREVQDALGRKVAGWATCGAACEADFDKTIRQDVLQDKRWWDRRRAAFEARLADEVVSKVVRDTLK